MKKTDLKRFIAAGFILSCLAACERSSLVNHEGVSHLQNEALPYGFELNVLQQRRNQARRLENVDLDISLLRAFHAAEVRYRANPASETARTESQNALLQIFLSQHFRELLRTHAPDRRGENRVATNPTVITVEVPNGQDVYRVFWIELTVREGVVRDFQVYVWRP